MSIRAANETTLRQLLLLTLEACSTVIIKVILRAKIILSERRIARMYRHLEHYDRDIEEANDGISYVSKQIINEVAHLDDLRELER